MKIFSVLLLGVLISCLGLSADHAHAGDIRLVLQITVDGLRGDLLTRYGDRFGTGGFRYLTENGTVYGNAHYQYANTETIVGHTTLATGAFPRDHGMVGNLWFDRDSGERIYNIEDPDYPLLPSRKEIVKGAQLDPAQKAARSNGRSPLPIDCTTFSDELAVHTAGAAKIFAVSGKDRGAVPLAGHSGKAFWFSTDSGDFVSSRFYYDAYPDWVVDWNAERQGARYAGKAWELLNDQSTYLLKAKDDRPYEVDLKGYGRVFPHPFGEMTHPLFNTRLLISPVGDRLTADFAKRIVVSEGLGQDTVPDYLSISFSGVDAVNHFFGPSSLENEDQVLQLDRTLADLLKFVDAKVGREHTLVVLAADHGMAEMPEAMAELGHPVGRLYSEDVERVANAAGKARFGVGPLVRLFYRPYLYLDETLLTAHKLDRDEVSSVLAEALNRMDGIGIAVPRALQAASGNPGTLGQIQNNYHPDRSGDIYVAQKPYWFLFEKGAIAVMHGSPWRYDTHVPIIVCGPGVPALKTQRRVHPVDIPATLSAYLGVKPPSNARGTPLVEVVDQSR